jgi:hypothetical protein
MRSLFLWIPMISPGCTDLISPRGFRDDLARHSDLMSPEARGVPAVWFPASAKPRGPRNGERHQIGTVGEIIPEWWEIERNQHLFPAASVLVGFGKP